MIYKAVSKTHAEIRLYGNIESYINNGDDFVSTLDYLAASGFKKVTIREHCYGGSVIEGNVIYNILQRADLKIDFIIEGIAASMGFFIILSVGDVKIAENGFGMIHRPKSFSGGDADALLTDAKLLQDMEANFIKRLSERTGLTEDEVKVKWFDGRDHWLNANEMLEYGIVKEITPATAKNIKDLDKESILAMSIENIYSRFAACLDIDNPNQNKTDMNKQELIEAFGLTGVTADSPDADVLAAIKAKKASMDSELAKSKDDVTKATTERDATIKAMLDQAKASGVIVAAHGKTIDEVYAAYENIGKTSGIAALSMVLPQQTTTVSIMGQIQPGASGASGADDTPKTFDDLVAQGDAAIAKFKAEKRSEYNKLYKAAFGHEPML